MKNGALHSHAIKIKKRKEKRRNKKKSNVAMNQQALISQLNLKKL